LLGTLHEFTVGVFECLDVLGVPYSDTTRRRGSTSGTSWVATWVSGPRAPSRISDTSIADLCKYFLPLDPKLRSDA
jgi:hypothetical protein